MSDILNLKLKKLINSFLIIILAFIINIGAFKNLDFIKKLPIDITIILNIVLIIGIIIYSIIFHVKFERKSSNFLIIFPIIFVASVMCSNILKFDQSNVYAVSKLLKFYGITVVCIFSPFFLFRNRDDLTIFFNTTAIFGLILSVVTIQSTLTGSDLIFRSVGLDSDPLMIARLCGFLIIYYFFGFKNKLSFFNLVFYFTMFALVPLIVSIITGSRGPIVFLVAAILLVYAIFEQEVWKKILIPTIILLFTFVTFFVVLDSNFISIESKMRITNSLSGVSDESLDKRGDLVQKTLEEIPFNPLGIGIGEFNKYNLLPTVTDQYPHNVLLEIILELGWFSGFIYLIFVVISVFVSYLSAKFQNDKLLKTLFCLILYSQLNSAVSGELNNDRAGFTLLTIGISLFLFSNYKFNELKKLIPANTQ